mmetsp:Transcript_16834/g.47195  ORF Transcript_16834/g.47195 Transcript_16834/m.47195 type:complete len:212 (+) Transcript_16834:1221-1856(+)
MWSVEFLLQRNSRFRRQRHEQRFHNLGCDSVDCQFGDVSLERSNDRLGAFGVSMAVLDQFEAAELRVLDFRNLRQRPICGAQFLQNDLSLVHRPELDGGLDHARRVMLQRDFADLALDESHQPVSEFPCIILRIRLEPQLVPNALGFLDNIRMPSLRLPFLPDLALLGRFRQAFSRIISIFRFRFFRLVRGVLRSALSFRFFADHFVCQPP